MTNVHAEGKILRTGADPDKAVGAVVMLHGRGASAEDILGLADAFGLDGVTYVAPEANGRVWYPYPFISPRPQNEPWMTHALERVEQVVQSLEASGLSREKIAVLGFSQGACLTTEFVASHPARYAAAIAFTGGLVGEVGSDLTHPGSLQETPVFLGASNPDPYIPWTRVQESAQVLERMGARVTLKEYPGMPHMVSQDEVAVARSMLKEAFGLY